MNFASDNSGPVHPQVMQALSEVNQNHAMAYGADPEMGEVRAVLRKVFEAPEAAIFLVSTGTAANALILATLGKPWQTIFCSPFAHIHQDECNAPEFFSSGAKLTLVPGGDKMSPRALRSAIAGEENRGVHGPQRGPVSITQVTERGSVYSLDEIRELTGVADEFGLCVHMDGARFANALVTLDCTPAEMTWKAGVDAVSFGGTKNGLMGAEAVIFFDPEHAWEFELRRKRAAHLVSKHRYLSAQMLGYLGNDLWLESARAANASCAKLAAGLRSLGAAFLHEPQANMIFASFSRETHRRLHAAGAIYHLWGAELEGDDPNELLPCRLVCDWSTTPDEIDRFLSLFT